MLCIVYIYVLYIKEEMVSLNVPIPATTGANKNISLCMDYLIHLSGIYQEVIYEIMLTFLTFRCIFRIVDSNLAERQCLNENGVFFKLDFRFTLPTYLNIFI